MFMKTNVMDGQVYYSTEKPPLKDTPKDDKPPNKNKGQAKGNLVHALYRKSPLKEDNLSTKDKTAGPKGVLIERFHYRPLIIRTPNIKPSIVNYNYQLPQLSEHEITKHLWCTSNRHISEYSIGMA